jgi:hypothetical protein
MALLELDTSGPPFLPLQLTLSHYFLSMRALAFGADFETSLLSVWGRLRVPSFCGLTPMHRNVDFGRYHVSLLMDEHLLYTFFLITSQGIMTCLLSHVDNSFHNAISINSSFLVSNLYP